LQLHAFSRLNNNRIKASSIIVLRILLVLFWEKRRRSRHTFSNYHPNIVVDVKGGGARAHAPVR
jgi:hypothetical protein